MIIHKESKTRRKKKDEGLKDAITKTLFGVFLELYKL